MSYFEDQEDAWFDNDCKGSPDQYDPYDPDSWPKGHTVNALALLAPKLTKSQKRNRARKRAKAAKRAAAKVEVSA
jgi:hypothetical protein